MSDREQFDVIVAGAGNAALLAAIAAKEQGAKVLVCEKAPEEKRGGNTYFTAGDFRVAYRNKQEVLKYIPDLSQAEIDSLVIRDYNEDDLFNDVMRVTAGMADPALLELVVHRSMSTVAWMVQQGLKWELSASTSVRREGKLIFPQGTVLQSKGGGAGLSDRLFEISQAKGIELRYETKVSNLLMDTKGSVYGLVTQDKDGFKELQSKAVILACGGFEANRAMRAQYLGKNWDIAKLRGTPYNTGDMLPVALSLGAMPFGHYSGCHASPIDAEAPDLMERSLTDQSARYSYPYGIMVNVDGKRFLDEGEDTHVYTYSKYGERILRQPQSIAFQIFDAKATDLLDERYSTGPCTRANSIPELADKLGIDAEGLSDTVEKFNAAIVDGEFDHASKDGKCTAGLEPCKSNWAQKIDSPPYVAYGVCCGITFTFGGLKVNENAQVVDTRGYIIPHLYACGEIVGGLYYHNYAGATGLAAGSVMGYIAGSHAAAE